MLAFEAVGCGVLRRCCEAGRRAHPEQKVRLAARLRAPKRRIAETSVIRRAHQEGVDPWRRKGERPVGAAPVRLVHVPVAGVVLEEHTLRGARALTTG